VNLSLLRRQIPALAQALYLNTGTFGPSPFVVYDAIREALYLAERHGPFSPVVRQAIERDAYEQTRERAAHLLGARSDEIVLTRSASDGVNIVAHGLDWRAGDEVVVTPVSNSPYPWG
jgi:selenocysteine lyase/cysteine desulfurase